MKTWKLSLLLITALTATGCIFVSDDDDEEVSNGVFHATWVWGGGQSCASTGVTDVEYLFTQQGTTQGKAFLFTCDEGAGDTDPLTLAGYTYVVSALDCSVATDPLCADGDNRGTSAPVTASFLAADGSAICDEVSGDTCFHDLATTTLQLTL